MELNKWPKIRPILLIPILLVLAIGIWSIAVRDQTELASTNFNTIIDSSIGLSFNMSKRFEPISRERLAAMNPGFTYGFQPTNDPNALCIVSQTKLTGRGQVSAQALRDGLIKEVKKTHPDVKLANPKTAANPVQFGEAKGVLLELVYKDGQRQIKRVEIIALGKANQVIAYCQSPIEDNQRYYQDFTVFFSSLKLDS